AVDQGVGVGVQYVALDVVQVKRGQFSSTHHAQQPAGLRLVLHQELLAEPGVQRVVQVALQGASRRPGEILLLFLCFFFLRLRGFDLLRPGRQTEGLLWLLLGRHRVYQGILSQTTRGLHRLRWFSQPDRITSLSAALHSRESGCFCLMCLFMVLSFSVASELPHTMQIIPCRWGQSPSGTRSASTRGSSGGGRDPGSG
ncbi:hypothetical protein INR49_002668, partial [Caranx melampygus]